MDLLSSTSNHSRFGTVLLTERTPQMYISPDYANIPTLCRNVDVQMVRAKCNRVVQCSECSTLLVIHVRVQVCDYGRMVPRPAQKDAAWRQ